MVPSQLSASSRALQDVCVRTGGVSSFGLGGTIAHAVLAFGSGGVVQALAVGNDPDASEALYTSLFEAARREAGMVAFEHDFVGQDSMAFGWPQQLGAASKWLRGMGGAAAAARTPIQFSLPVASDLLESLAMPWVTSARASARSASRARREYVMLSSTVPANSTGSWLTIPITEWSQEELSIETSTPSSVTAPSVGS